MKTIIESIVFVLGFIPSVGVLLASLSMFYVVDKDYQKNNNVVKALLLFPIPLYLLAVGVVGFLCVAGYGPFAVFRILYWPYLIVYYIAAIILLCTIGGFVYTVMLGVILVLRKLKDAVGVLMKKVEQQCLKCIVRIGRKFPVKAIEQDILDIGGILIEKKGIWKYFSVIDFHGKTCTFRSRKTLFGGSKVQECVDGSWHTTYEIRIANLPYGLESLKRGKRETALMKMEETLE